MLKSKSLESSRLNFWTLDLYLVLQQRGTSVAFMLYAFLPTTVNPVEAL